MTGFIEQILMILIIMIIEVPSAFILGWVAGKFRYGWIITAEIIYVAFVLMVFGLVDLINNKIQITNNDIIYFIGIALNGTLNYLFWEEGKNLGLRYRRRRRSL